MELVPYVGPVLGALPPVIVALVQDPLMAVWVVLLFLALQQLEGHVVAPNVFGRALRLNPLLVILALLLGGQIYGFVGALVALPIAAVLRETVVYLRRHLVFEPWGTAIAADRRPRPPTRRRPSRRRRRRARAAAPTSAAGREGPDAPSPLRVDVVDPAHALGLGARRRAGRGSRRPAPARSARRRRTAARRRCALISWCGT